jgi:hypothetical protein
VIIGNPPLSVFPFGRAFVDGVRAGLDSWSASVALARHRDRKAYEQDDA